MSVDAPAPPSTLAALLQPAAVDFGTLERRYSPLLELVRAMIGVVPNCDPLLEIWPPGFRTYNLMVPNFLNLPFLLFGVGPPTETVGLAMYAASRASGCAYCSAHCCSFALRRGATPEQIADALTPGAAHTPDQRAAIVAAAALGQVPSTFSREHVEDLERHFSPHDAERLAVTAAMMGFLNKFMDAMGVPLEPPTIAEAEPIIGSSGWAVGNHDPGGPITPGAAPRVDSLRSKLAVLRQVPQAVRLERRWTAGVPGRWPAAGQHLRQATGHDFPLLGRFRDARPRRALTAMLLTNLDASATEVGLRDKALAGLVYAAIVQNDTLVAEARMLARAHGADEALVDATAECATAPPDARAPGESDPALAATLALAKEASPSPATISAGTIRLVGDSLAPAAVIEIVVWLAVQQLMHRLDLFYAARAA